MSKGRIQHPAEPLLRQEHLPFVWCSGCGIGIVVNSFLQTIQKMQLDPAEVCIVSSEIGCTGKIAEYLKFKRLTASGGDLFHAGLIFKKKNPGTKVVLFFNENDLISSGVDGLLEICRKGAEILAVYINSYIYNLFIEHREFLDVPFLRNAQIDASFSPFNIPHLAKNCGAELVARWTPLHCRRLIFSMRKALMKEGFSMIEVISPCLMYHASDGNLGKTIDRMGNFLRNSIIMNEDVTEKLDTRDSERIVVGTFVDK